MGYTLWYNLIMDITNPEACQMTAETFYREVMQWMAIGSLGIISLLGGYGYIRTKETYNELATILANLEEDSSETEE